MPLSLLCTVMREREREREGERERRRGKPYMTYTNMHKQTERKKDR